MTVLRRASLPRWRVVAPVVALFMVFMTSAAHAQSIDYGSLEALFREPVTTSATGTPQRASDVPATMEIITAAEIRRSGAKDIPGVLRHVAGIDVLQWTNDGEDVGIRGYNQAYSPRLLVLIDGRQVYADYYGYTPWSTLPVELAAIRQIEVVKGPNAALFGFNAVGGVINIVTYNPLYDTVNTASLTGGTQGLAEGSAIATAKLGTIGGVRISVGGRSNDDFSTPQRPADQGTRLGDNRGAIDVLAAFRLGDNLSLNFEASHTKVDQDEIIPFNTGFFVEYRTNAIKGQLLANSPMGNLQATVYNNWIAATFPYQPPYPFVRNDVTVGQLQDVFTVGNAHTFRLSVEYRYNTEITTTIKGGNVFYDVASAGGMWEWKITPAVSLTNALRLDRLDLGRNGYLPPGYGLTNADWNRSLTGLNFNSGLVWRLDDANTIRVTAARGLQLPSLVDLGAVILPGPSGYQTGSPTVHPTSVTNFELGWDRSLASIGAQLRVSAYHEITRQLISVLARNTIAEGFGVQPANAGNSEATGAEISLKGMGERWRWGLSYTPEIITDHFASGVSLATAGIDFQHTTPVNVVNANLGWVEGRWEVDGYLRYQSASSGVQGSYAAFGLDEKLVRIPDYLSLDARIGYQLTDWAAIAVSGQNIASARQQQTIEAEVERRVLATLTFTY